MNVEAHKTTDTVIIYGSGWSLNDVGKEGWDKLSSYDSIGFNWFVLQEWIKPTFMIVGDIRPEKTLDFSGNNIEDTYKKYFSHLSDRYRDTLFILRDDQLSLLPSEFSAYKHHIVTASRNDGSEFGESLDKMFFNKSTLFSALDWAFKLKYRKVIFAGVDLYDYRFFWLPPNVGRAPGTPEMKPVWAKRGINKRHPIHKKTLNWFRNNRKLIANSGIKLFSYNEKSLLLLDESINTWKGE